MIRHFLTNLYLQLIVFLMVRHRHGCCFDRHVGSFRNNHNTPDTKDHYALKTAVPRPINGDRFSVQRKRIVAGPSEVREAVTCPRYLGDLIKGAE